MSRYLCPETGRECVNGADCMRNGCRSMYAASHPTAIVTKPRKVDDVTASPVHTWSLTNLLRFIERSDGQTVTRTLQQLFRDPSSGAEEWRDVPVVKEGA